MTKSFLRALALVFVMLALVACDRLMSAEDAGKSLQHYSLPNDAGQRPPLSAFAYYQLGFDSAYNEKYEEAIEYFNLSLARDPQYALAYSGRAHAYLDLNELDKALADYTKAVELDPQYAWAYLWRGKIYQSLAKYDEAIADYTKAIDIGTTDDPVKLFAQAHFHRCDAFTAQNKLQEAAPDCQSSIEIDPQNTQAYDVLAWIYHLQLNYDEAIAASTAALKIDPQLAGSYYVRGYSYWAKNEIDLALQDFESCVSVDPNYYACIFGQGEMHRLRGERDYAIDDFLHALQFAMSQPELRLVNDRLKELGVASAPVEKDKP